MKRGTIGIYGLKSTATEMRGPRPVASLRIDWWSSPMRRVLASAPLPSAGGPGGPSIAIIHLPDFGHPVIFGPIHISKILRLATARVLETPEYVAANNVAARPHGRLPARKMSHCWVSALAGIPGIVGRTGRELSCFQLRVPVQKVTPAFVQIVGGEAAADLLQLLISGRDGLAHHLHTRLFG